MGQPLPPPAPRPLPPPQVLAPRRPRVDRTPLPRLDGRDRQVVIAEMVIVGFMLAAPGLVFGLQGLGEAREIETDVTYFEIAAQVLAAFGPALLCCFLLWRDGVLGVSFFRKRRPGFVIGWGSLTLVCMFGAAMVGGLLIFALQELLGSEASSNVNSDTELTVRYLVLALALSITAGVTEEAIWRGYFVARMEQAGFVRWAIIGPSAVWVLLHVYGGPYTLIGITFIGAPLVWMAWWKRSVWPLMLAHVAWDVFAFLIATVDSST
jgi:membrane protease YdiL (CAAX protease family)